MVRGFQPAPEEIPQGGSQGDFSHIDAPVFGIHQFIVGDGGDEGFQLGNSLRPDKFPKKADRKPGRFK